MESAIRSLDQVNLYQQDAGWMLPASSRCTLPKPGLNQATALQLGKLVKWDHDSLSQWLDQYALCMWSREAPARAGGGGGGGRGRNQMHHSCLYWVA